MVLNVSLDAPVAHHACRSRGGAVQRVTDGQKNIRLLASGKPEARNPGVLGCAQLGIDPPLQQLHLVVTGRGAFLLVRVRRLKIRVLGLNRSRSRREEHVALIGAARTAHVSHAEAFDFCMNKLIAKTMVFSVRTELHHAEGSHGPWIKVDAVVRVAACADERIHTRSRPGDARRLRMRTARAYSEKQGKDSPPREGECRNRILFSKAF